MSNFILHKNATDTMKLAYQKFSSLGILDQGNIDNYLSITEARKTIHGLLNFDEGIVELEVQRMVLLSNIRGYLLYTSDVQTKLDKANEIRIELIAELHLKVATHYSPDYVLPSIRR